MSSPSTIFRGITFRIVDAINCVFIGAYSHVAKKIIEYLPSITNFYAARPISKIFFIARILTACSHGGPANVSATSTGSRRMAMPCVLFSYQYIFHASARIGMAMKKIASRYIDDIAAVALAFPKSGTGFSGNFSNSPDCDQISRGLRYKIQSSKFSNRHNVSPHQSVVFRSPLTRERFRASSFSHIAGVS
jgi:hypothetical protein